MGQTHGDQHHHHSQEGLSSNRNASLLEYILCLASLPSIQHPSSCLRAYLTPWCQLPLGFGGRPAVPRVFHSTILLNRNSSLNHPADCVEQLHTARLLCTHPRSYSSCAQHVTPNLLSQGLLFQGKALCWARGRELEGHSKLRTLETPRSGMPSISL